MLTDCRSDAICLNHFPKSSLTLANTCAPGTAFTRPERSSFSRRFATSAHFLSYFQSLLIIVYHACYPLRLFPTFKYTSKCSVKTPTIFWENSFLILELHRLTVSVSNFYLPNILPKIFPKSKGSFLGISGLLVIVLLCLKFN